MIRSLWIVLRLRVPWKTIGVPLVTIGTVLATIWIWPRVDRIPRVDRVLVSGPRAGAFFSCGCARDRRGGMTLARAHVPGRVLWVEVGDPFGDTETYVRRFLNSRVHAFRIEAESEPAPVFRLGGRYVRLVFVDRLTPGDLARLPRSEPLLCVAQRFSHDVWREIRDREGLYVVANRLAVRERRMRIVSYEGAEGRQVVVVGSDLVANVVDVLPKVGQEADPLDTEYLRDQHARAGVLQPDGEPGRLAAEDPAKCAACHPGAVERWKKSQHAHALEAPGTDAPRHCFACHSVTRDRPRELAPRFAVTCGSCHGRSHHHPDPSRPLGSADCTGCHTKTSSPGFDRSGYWSRIRCG
ncbi:MAG: multiheme c-type cytochrome [Planctomycetota bacterium]